MKTPTQATPENRSNTDNTTQADLIKPTTGLDSIRNDLAEDGFISLSGNTPLSDLLKIGAIAYTTHHDFDTGRMETATDELGLNLMKEQLSTGITIILDGIGVVADLMSTNGNNISGNDVSKIGWLICGLAEMASDMHYHKNRFEHELRKTNP